MLYACCYECIVRSNTHPEAMSPTFDISIPQRLQNPCSSVAVIEDFELPTGVRRIEGLAGLESLRRLNLASNGISKIEGLAGLTALEYLSLQDNKLSNLKDLNLALLSELPSLAALYFQNADRSLPNPICTLNDYKKEVVGALPFLKNLDGERCACWNLFFDLHPNNMDCRDW